MRARQTMLIFDPVELIILSPARRADVVEQSVRFIIVIVLIVLSDEPPYHTDANPLADARCSSLRAVAAAPIATASSRGLHRPPYFNNVTVLSA